MGMAAILGMWPWPFEGTFVPPTHKSRHIKFGFNWPSGFWGEDTLYLKMLTDGRRTTDAYLYYKLTNEHSAQVS